MVNKRILIVEDEADIRAALTAWIEDEGFDIAEADNGIDGLSEFERFKPDLALLDLNLPGISGVELCRRIRQRSQIPLVMFTAAADVEEVQAAINEGATDWVLKHSGFDNLIDRITEHLNVEREGLSKAEFDEPVSAQVLSPIDSHSDGLQQTVAITQDGDLDLSSPTADDLWTWSGEYFGFREGDDLWTFAGYHVGRFRRGVEVFRPDGLYLGDVMDGRLIVDWHKTARRASSFVPYEDKTPREKFADREQFDMQIGFKDFPGPTSLSTGERAL
jgi:DNA-binding response OmpR family regulator